MKVLEIVGEINGGGVGSVIYNYLSHIHAADISFDILVFEGKSKIKKNELKKFKDIGCNAYSIPHRNKGYVKHFKLFKKLIETNKYDVVHCHLGEWSMPYLLIAKREGVAKRMAHIHTAQEEYRGIKRMIVKSFKYLLPKLTTCIIACGKEARKNFGVKLSNICIMNNAIDLEEYSFSNEIRNDIRRQLNIKDSAFVIGHVGRFAYQKNQSFIVNIANSVKEDKDIQFILVGDGEDYEYIKAISLKYNLPIRFLGYREDIKELLNAFDLFVLPSYYEGVPVSAIEAQANGLPVILSDKISNEVCLIPESKRMRIDGDGAATLWGDEIKKLKKIKRSSNENSYDILSQSGFNIKNESLKLYQMYIS